MPLKLTPAERRDVAAIVEIIRRCVARGEDGTSALSHALNWAPRQYQVFIRIALQPQFRNLSVVQTEERFAG